MNRLHLVVVAAALALGTRASANPFPMNVSVPGAGGAPAPVPEASNCHLNYYGGPLIQKVKVVVVFWGTTNNNQYSKYASQLAAYYGAITASPYMDMLQEYNVTGYSIARGTYVSSYGDPSPPSGSQIDDSQVQTYLADLISKKLVPAPDDDTIYQVHFPSTVTITQGGSASCQYFCAYHHSFSNGGQNVRYSVMPDVTAGACSQGCGANSDPFKNICEVASHELIEAITDPDGNSSWVDTSSQSCGEIGDICVGEVGTAAGYTVQLEWSNKQGKCADHDPSIVVNDFTLTLDATTNADAGASGTAMLTSAPTSGSMAMALTLAVAGLPSGVTGTFSPASIQSNAGTTLTFKVAASVAPGSYPYTVTATGASAMHTAMGTLKVKAATQPDMAGGGGDDDGGMGGGGNDDGGTGGGGGGGGGKDGGGGGVGGGPIVNGNNGGCNCSFGGTERSAAAGWALLGLIAIAVFRRRRA